MSNQDWKPAPYYCKKDHKQADKMCWSVHPEETVRCRDWCQTCNEKYECFRCRNEKAISLKDAGRESHRLTQINEDARAATCSICGDTDIHRKGLSWRCGTRNSQKVRNSRKRTNKPAGQRLSKTSENGGSVAEPSEAPVGTSGTNTFDPLPLVAMSGLGADAEDG